MSDETDKLRALSLSVLVVLSVFVGSIAFSGAVAAATNTSITPDDDDAGASDVTYTADGYVELDNQDTLNYVDVHLSPADVGDVGESDVSIYVDGNEYTDGLTEFSATSGTVEFKLSNSRSISDGDRVRIVVADVTNPSDDFDASTTLHDSGDAQWQEYTDTVAIDTPPDVSYHDLQFADSRGSGNDTTVNVGETLDVSATINNSGEQTGTYNASFEVDGDVLRYNNGTLAGMTNTSTSFQESFDSTGAQDVTIKDLPATEVTITGPMSIAGGSASPAQVTPGTTVNNQKVYVEVANVSQDGDTDWHYVEFPDALASGLSVNTVSANATSITSSPNLVDGYDNDGTTETVKFATSGDGGGDIALNLTVDASVQYPDTETTYGVDARTVDSGGDTSTQEDVANISTETAPTISSYSASNPSGRDVDVSFDSDEQLVDIAVDIVDSGGTTVATLTESDFTETSSGDTYTYDATETLGEDGDYDVVLNNAADDEGNDGASGQTRSVRINTVSVAIEDGSADPDPVPPGSTVNNQEIVVTVSGVSADGDTDRFFVELPNDLASGLSVNSASVNGSASIAQSAELVEGYDDDGTDETIRFQTDTDAGGTVPLNVTVDVSVDYPDTSATYDVDARVEDSDGDTAEQSGVTSIQAADTADPIITDYSVTNPADRDVTVAFDSDEQLSQITVDLTDSSDTTVATLTESDFSESSANGEWMYEATYAVASDGDYTATLTEAADSDGNDGASGESETVSVDSSPAVIAGGSANPSSVTPGETVSNQVVHVTLSDVSADGDTDWHYVEFPDALADSLSVNSANANATSITSSAELVEGFDDDLTTDTVRFATSSDAGGDIDLDVSVDVSVDYPDSESTYGIDTQLVDSEAGSMTESDVATIEAIEADSGGGDDESSDDDTTIDDGGGIDSGGVGDITVTDQLENAPGITDVALTSDGQTVTIDVTTNRSVSTLEVDVDGPVDADLVRSDFTATQQDGNYVHSADVAAAVPGSYEATVERVVADGREGPAGQSASLVVGLPDHVESTAVAVPPWTGDSDSVHTFNVPVTADANVANQTLTGLDVQYSDGFLNTSGSISSVSDDQNVATLLVVDENGTVQSRMGGTDAVTVNVANGAVQLDLSDVDSSRKPTLDVGDRVIVRLRPVTNPAAAGSYDTAVRLESASGNSDELATDIRIRSQSGVEAFAAEYVAPSEDHATVDLTLSDTLETVTVGSVEDAGGIVRVIVPDEPPASASSLSESVVTTLRVTRPDAAVDEQATVTAEIAADEFAGDASALTLARYDPSAESWTQLSTSVVDQGDDTVTIRATAQGTSTFAVTTDGSGQDQQAQQTTDEQQTENQQQTDTQQTSEQQTTEQSTPEEETTDTSGPGFGIGLAAVALIGAALALLYYRRERE